jgi:uncharacterized protein (TIGR03435 family)
MATLADILAFSVGSPVVDSTGLQGGYDIDLKWSPELERAASGPESDLPSIFTAVQEQLGLMLDAQQVPMEMLVIDSVSRPTEN